MCLHIYMQKYTYTNDNPSNNDSKNSSNNSSSNNVNNNDNDNDDNNNNDNDDNNNNNNNNNNNKNIMINNNILNSYGLYQIIVYLFGHIFRTTERIQQLSYFILSLLELFPACN